jgi:hypothetical protein
MNRKYLLAYYQIRENIGPNGNYTLAVYDTAGKLTDTINFDVFKVYLEASDEVIVYKDSIKVSINNKKHLLNIDEHGRFKNKESLKPD